MRYWREAFYQWLAYRLPRGVASWCLVRIVAEATTGAYSDQVVPDLTAMTALVRWDAETTRLGREIWLLRILKGRR